MSETLKEKAFPRRIKIKALTIDTDPTQPFRGAVVDVVDAALCVTLEDAEREIASVRNEQYTVALQDGQQIRLLTEERNRLQIELRFREEDLGYVRQALEERNRLQGELRKEYWDERRSHRDLRACLSELVGKLRQAKLITHGDSLAFEYIKSGYRNAADALAEVLASGGDGATTTATDDTGEVARLRKALGIATEFIKGTIDDSTNSHGYRHVSQRVLDQIDEALRGDSKKD